MPDGASGTASADVPAAPVYRPTPTYPREAVCLRQEGTAYVVVTLDENGVPIDRYIERSTGSRTLDKAAADTVMSWRFTPEYRAGLAVGTRRRIPVDFKLPVLSVPDCIDVLGAHLDAGAGNGAPGTQFRQGAAIEAVVQYQLHVSWPFRAGMQATLRHRDPTVGKAVARTFQGVDLVPSGPQEARLSLQPLDPGRYVLELTLADEALEPIHFTVVAADAALDAAAAVSVPSAGTH